MSFRNVYFSYGYQATMEKIAAKKKEDEGMGLGAKLGLGAAGLGAAGLGAYFGGDALKDLGTQAADYAANNSESAMSGLGGLVDNDTISSVGKGLGTAGDFLNTHGRDNMQTAFEAMKDKAQDLKHQYDVSQLPAGGATSAAGDAAYSGDVKGNFEAMLEKVKDNASKMKDHVPTGTYKPAIDTSANAMPNMSEALENAKGYWGDKLEALKNSGLQLPAAPISGMNDKL